MLHTSIHIIHIYHTHTHKQHIHNVYFRYEHKVARPTKWKIMKSCRITEGKREKKTNTETLWMSRQFLLIYLIFVSHLFRPITVASYFRYSNGVCMHANKYTRTRKSTKIQFLVALDFNKLKTFVNPAAMVTENKRNNSS